VADAYAHPHDHSFMTKHLWNLTQGGFDQLNRFPGGDVSGSGLPEAGVESMEAHLRHGTRAAQGRARQR